MEIGETDSASIHKPLQEKALALGLQFESCLDIGSGTRIQRDWFNKFRLSVPPRQFVAAEVDEALLTELTNKGVEVLNPSVDEDDRKFDLTMALEVIEHQKETEIVGFLNWCERKTNKLFVLTTPNFEYWKLTNSIRDARALPDYVECRWIPDHFSYYDASSNDPHFHKFPVTPAALIDFIRDSSFGSPAWDFKVFRAWPWSLTDQARGNRFDLYFKIFCLAWRV